MTHKNLQKAKGTKHLEARNYKGRRGSQAVYFLYTQKNLLRENLIKKLFHEKYLVWA